MKKQILLLAMILLPMVAGAEAVEIDGIYYNLISKGKVAEVSNRLGGSVDGGGSYSGNVVIPASVAYDGAEYSVTSIGNSAFYWCGGLTSITIPSSMTSIGNHAFSGCSGLTSITIPNSVTSIGNSAFYNCSGLTSVTIGNSVTSIGSEVFYNCSGLTSVTIPNSVISIGNYAFQGCSGLTSVTIPNSVTSLGISAFYNCSGLTAITIPNSVTSIGDYGFYGCSGLTSVTIPNSITRIGWYTFSGCSGLTYITIPNSVTSIGSSAFSGCSGLTSVTIPNSVTNIGNSAFEDCSGLTSVTIPNSVTSIDGYAFGGCSGLTSVTIGSGVKIIYSQAFASCKDLTDVYCLAEEVPSTNTNAFQDSYIEYATLHVPTASIDAYMAAEPWKNFKEIKTLTGEDIPVTLDPEKCATPTIAFVDGKLKFSCETEDAEFVYDIKSTYSVHGVGSEVMPVCQCTVTVYATRQDYDNSDVATLEFSLGASGEVCDVNKDGTVDVADIATIISTMAGKK